jgi:4-amino-4-deoxy-L-arabinose transferase-like glycosyltransferase
LDDDRHQNGGDLPRGRAWACLAGILVLALLLRVWTLPRESAWWDELLSLPHVDAPTFAAYWDRLQATDVSMVLVPFYYSLEYVWAQAFGTGLVTVRLLSVLAGMLSVAVLYALGARLYGRRAGLAAALLLALSMPHIFYSQEIRRYAWGCFMVLLSFHTLFRLPPPGERDRGAWAAYLAATLVMPWATTYAAVALAVQGLWLLGTRRIALRGALAWGGLMVANLAAVAAWILSVPKEELFWIPRPGWREVANTFVVAAGGRFSNDDPGAFLWSGVSLDLLLAAALYAAAAAAVVMAFRRWGPPGDRRAATYALAGWLVIAPPVWFLISTFYRPLYIYRYFLFASYPLYLLAAGAWVAVPRRGLRAATLAAVVLLMAYQASLVFQGPFRPEYDAAVRVIREADEGEGVMAGAPVLALKHNLNKVPLQWAGGFEEARVAHAEGEGSLFDETERLWEQAGRLWVVTWRWDRMGRFYDHARSLGADVRVYRLGGWPALHLVAVRPPEER